MQSMKAAHLAQLDRNLAQARDCLTLLRHGLALHRAHGTDASIVESLIQTMQQTRALLQRIHDVETGKFPRSVRSRRRDAISPPSRVVHSETD